MTRTDKWQDEFDKRFKYGFAEYSSYEPEHQVELRKDIKQFISQVQQDTIQECIEVLEGMKTDPYKAKKEIGYGAATHYFPFNHALDQAITKLKEI